MWITKRDFEDFWILMSMIFVVFMSQVFVQSLVDAAATHYCILRVKAELHQLVEGLNVFKIGQLISEDPQILRELFVHFKPLPLTSDRVFEMFPPDFSHTNAREIEEEVVMNWVHLHPRDRRLAHYTI